MVNNIVKISCLIMMLGFILLNGIGLAHADDESIVKFSNKYGGNKFEVYRFYDTTFNQLCYATSEAIHCVPWVSLDQTSRKFVRKMILDNNKLSSPKDIIKLKNINYSKPGTKQIKSNNNQIQKDKPL